jgi:hypothetical protein
MNMAPNEPSFSEKLIQRRESVRQTLRKTSPEELRALVRELDPEGTHPWAVSFSKFIDEHQAEPAVRGETSDGISFVYYPQFNRGFWYAYKEKRLVGVGLLGETNLKALSQICSETGH